MGKLVVSKPTGAAAAGAALKQVRLHDCKKVQVLCSISAREEELAELHQGLQSAIDSGGPEQQLHYLRRVSCYELTLEQLTQYPIGPLVRVLRASENADVARVANGVLEKLRDVARRKAKALCKKK